MSSIFEPRPVHHKTAVRMVRSFLPGMENRYNLKPLSQPELDIPALAAKAKRYNMAVSPDIIEMGMNAAMELILLLIADGYRIKTPLFTVSTRIRGVYDGTETKPAEGVYPEARIEISPAFRNYIRENVKVRFAGFEDSSGAIGRVVDISSGLENSVLTKGSFLAIHGAGLKIRSESDNREKAGVYFIPESGEPIKADTVFVNEPRTLKLQIPAALTEGASYTIAVITQSAPKGHGVILKNLREVFCPYTLTAREKETPLPETTRPPSPGGETTPENGPGDS